MTYETSIFRMNLSVNIQLKHPWPPLCPCNSSHLILPPTIKCTHYFIFILLIVYITARLQAYENIHYPHYSIFLALVFVENMNK